LEFEETRLRDRNSSKRAIDKSLFRKRGFWYRDAGALALCARRIPRTIGVQGLR
jgi:hypothetical protein